MMRRWVDSCNWWLLGIVLVIVSVGLLNLYSAVYFWGEEGSLAYFWNQLLWVCIGLVCMGLAAVFDYRLFYQLSRPIYVFVLILLLLAALTGPEIHGTRGWLSLGPVKLQPAEFAKLSYVLVAARYFSDNPSDAGYGLLELWRPILLMLLPFGVIVYQGDMGSSLFLLCIFTTLAFFVGVQRRTLIAFLVIAVVGAGMVYEFGLKPYQRDRIFNFLNPEQDVRGSGYHLVQSKIAVGSGGAWGKGYLKGNINKLQYLPERHTDFIFPVLAEEWGFVGSTVVLLLYLSFLLLGVDIARNARDRFGTFLAIGIVAMIFWQVAINLGGVLGLIPLTGVPLPMLSYGGSSMLTLLISAGILLSISARRFMF